MATSISLSTPTQKKYTPSFINQLQAEWNEFMLEISHSTPHEKIINNNDLTQLSKNNKTKEILIESLNKFNFATGGNILIPVPLNTLKKLFSPSKCNADDIFKTEFFNEIKENLNLTSYSCQRLQKLLFSDDNEISDFPSPSVPKNFRKSAPPRLFSKKQKAVNQQSEFLRIINCFKHDKDENLQKNVKNTNICQVIKNNEDNFVKENKHNENPPRFICEDVQLNNNNKKEKNRKPLSTQKKVSKRNNIKKEKKNLNNNSPVTKNGVQERYSSIYDLHLPGGSESSSLFYTFEPTKKKVKPTIVCTYFSQTELAKMYETVTNLRFFDIENQVSSRTTHLICGSSNKTINLCKAIARGCWILDKQWVMSSGEENRWLLEEKFEKLDFSVAVRENRLKRQKLGPAYKCDVFSKCGSMYVSKSCTQPSVEDLTELILLGSGRLEEKPEKAAYIIGYMPKHKYVKEIWVLNCVLQNYIVDINKYTRLK